MQTNVQTPEKKKNGDLTSALNLNHIHSQKKKKKKSVCGIFQLLQHPV